MALATLTTPTHTDITETTAVIGANLTSDGGEAVTERGTVYGTSPNPTTNADFTGANGIITDGADGFITLNSTLLGNLFGSNKDLMIVMVCQPTFVQDGIMWSAEGMGSIFWPRFYMHGTINDRFDVFWSTSGAGGQEASVQHLSVPDTLGHVFVFTLDQSNTDAHFAYDDQAADSDTDVSSLEIPSATQIRLGAQLDTPEDYATMNAGFFAILNADPAITGVPADDALSEAISAAIYGTRIPSGWRAEDIRAMICSVNSGITGEFWKLNEAGNTGAFDSQNVTKYKIQDGSVLSELGGVSSVAGCDGVELGTRVAQVAYTMSRECLLPGTTYYYRGYAINASGTAYSPDGTFETLGDAGGGGGQDLTRGLRGRHVDSPRFR